MDDSLVKVLLYVAVGVVFVIGSIVRKYQETREVNQRRGESRDLTLEEMPEQLKRLLLGDEPSPVRPPRPSEDGVNDEGWGDVVPPPRRPQPLEPRVARPRQGAPVARPQAAPIPPLVAPVQRQAPPSARPAEQQRTVVPQRQPVRQAPQRPIPVEQSARQVTPPMRRQEKPMQRPSQRDAVRSAQVRNTEVQEGPRKVPAAAPGPRPVSRGVRRKIALFKDIDEVRRAVVFSEILGAPKAFD